MAILFALMAPVIIGFVGVGVDVGSWYQERRSMQSAADTAAVAAALERSQGGATQSIDAAAQQEATRNGFNAATDTIQVNVAPHSGAYKGDSNYVEVVITHPLNLYFSKMFLNNAVTATTRAVATTQGKNEACVLALNSTAQNAIYMNGATSDVSMEGCGVVANSNDPKAVNVQNGEFEVDCVSTVGGVSGAENIKTEKCPAPITGASAVADPYSGLTVPSYSGCDHDPAGNKPYTPAEGETMTEGVYCGGIKVSSGDTVYMDPGIYIMDKGDFNVMGNAHLEGHDVTIILTSSSGSGYGSFLFTGNDDIALSAPTAADNSGSLTGDYTGVLIYQDRNAPTTPSLDARLTGGSDSELDGLIYMPNNDISFSGGNSTDDNGCLMLIAQKISFNGGADIENKCDKYNSPKITYGDKPLLVE